MQFETKNVVIDKKFDKVQLRMIAGGFPRTWSGGLDFEEWPENTILFEGTVKDMVDLYYALSRKAVSEVEFIFGVDDVPFNEFGWTLAIFEDIAYGKKKQWDVEYRKPIKDAV